MTEVPAKRFEAGFDHVVDTESIRELDRFTWRRTETEPIPGLFEMPIPLRINESFKSGYIKLYYDETALKGVNEKDLVVLWRESGAVRFR